MKRPWVATIGITDRNGFFSLLGVGYGATKKAASMAAAEQANFYLRDRDQWYGGMTLRAEVANGRTKLWGGYRLVVQPYTAEREAEDRANDTLPWGVRDLLEGK